MLYNLKRSSTLYEGIQLKGHMLATAKSVLDSAAEFFGRGIAAEAETPTVNLEAPDTKAASPFGYLNNFYFKILSNFWGSLHFEGAF